MFNVIFVDFDDTLCVHTEYLNTTFDNVLFAEPAVACAAIYKNSLANTPLIEYLKFQKEHYGTKIIMLSAANSKLLEVKRFWCKQIRPDLIDDFVSSSYEMTKIQIAQAYCKQFSIKPEHALLLDDSWAERKEAYAANIPCATPQEIMLRWNQ